MILKEGTIELIGMRNPFSTEEAEQPLQILLNTVLTKAFDLNDADRRIADVLLEYLDELDQDPDVLSAWQRPSFYEWLIPRFELQESDSFDSSKELFAALFRSNKEIPHAAVDISNFTPVSGEKIHVPPVRIPVIPFAYRFSRGQKTADEVTVVSWIPSLAQAVKQPHWLVLNRFFGARKVHCVWCDPAQIRCFLARHADRVMITPRLPESEVALNREYVNGVGRPWINLADFALPEELLKSLTATLFKAVPVYWSDWMATLAVNDRLSADDHNYLSQLYHNRITFAEVDAEPHHVEKWLTHAASSKINIPGLADRLRPASDNSSIHIKKVQQVDLEKLNRQIAQGKISTEDVVHLILTRGIDLDVSDIKLRSEDQKGLFVHYKTNGYWIKPLTLQWEAANLIISVLKDKAGLRTERIDIPQDGQFQIGHNHKTYLFRIHTSYHVSGEQVILRMKRDASTIRSLVSIGMPERYVEKLHQILQGRAGLIVFSGPTGCGKSTTIYSILNEFDPLQYNIQTAEAPIEVVMPHVNQVEIADFGRNTFLNWVRGIVREAPDILMMGEIRDLETADALLRVVNTGHRVITTLHANSAAMVPIRFLQLGVQPFLIASTLRMALSQCLVKMVCPHCDEEVPIPGRDKLKKMKINSEWLDGAKYFKVGRGCSHCNGTGFEGRKALYEALIVDDEVAQALYSHPTPEKLRALMLEKGEVTLLEKAVREAAHGVISLEEATQLALELSE
jgi:type II secretory ATPase GspE/PulE/Tfp pilus assembly ATPase PilB-like protein